MAYAALISLHTTIMDLENSCHITLSAPSVPILKLAIEAAKSLRETMELLDESSKSYSRKNVNALDERIKAAVWTFEDLLDSHLYHQIFPQSQILAGGSVVEIHVHEIIDDIDSFTKMLVQIKWEYFCELGNLSSKEEVEIVSSAIDSGVKNCKMVGSPYRSILWRIRRRLEMKRSLEVISLVGMAGIGKTALANKIFFADEFGFECRAWVTIGRKWEPHKLIRDILIQLVPFIGDAERCLIVLDDVWDTDLWDHFKRSMPHIFGTTLVLLTTRLLHVARYAEARIYAVELLDNAESWDLLRLRVFGEEDSCPPELEKAGKKIAQKCDGLPLMIVTVADLLREAEMTVEYWESVAKEEKNSSIFTTAYDRLSEVLFPSYEYLPQHLKPCFLHMGVYLQGCPITASQIFEMWMTGGFLLSHKNKTIEECCDRYLMELYDHSVVIICQRSVNSETIKSRAIKACRLQSAFWHLCKREATNTKFFHILTTLDDLENNMNTQRRLSFHNNILFGINNLSDFVGTARSLLCYGPFHPYAVPICFNLRLLKVLDAKYIRFYEFPILVFQLVYLRFLSILYDGELPASISKLWNLRFLTIARNNYIRHSGVTSYMPIEIWTMKQLKHLQVLGSNLPNPSNGVSLENLLRLKYVGVESCTKEVLERIPNLKKFSILVFLHPGDDDDMKAFHCLKHVHVLSALTSLTCYVANPFLGSEIVTLPAPLPMLPSSLKKLHLNGTGYPWSYMSVIGSLPHLQVLKLRNYAFRGSEWVVNDGQLQTLKVLRIMGTDLVRFKVKIGGFPDLEVLRFTDCYKLRDIQWEHDQSSRVVIQVDDCSTSVVAFANKSNSTWPLMFPKITDGKLLNLHI